MPVDTKHPKYEQFLDKWCKCRDVVAGEEAVKDAGTKYLPYVGKYTEPNFYAAYKERASFYAATQRTLNAMVGLLFRKPLSLDGPTTFIEDVNRSFSREGEPLATFTQRLSTYILKVGRAGVLLDMPSGDLTKALPYVTLYSTFNIINWRSRQRVDEEEGIVRDELEMVVLQEEHFEYEDPFTVKVVPQLRVLLLEEGTYFVTIYRKRKRNTAEEWVAEEIYAPTIRGEPLSHIPFVIFNASSLVSEPEEPPLLQLANVNVSHYRSSADLEHGLHFTGLPTPWLAGFSLDTEFQIGSSVAWVTEQSDAKAGFLEFTGKGLGEISSALDRKERHMAVLGARLLEAEKRAAETAESQQIRRIGENSILSTSATTVSSGMTRILRWYWQWKQAVIDDNIGLDINQQYTEFNMEPQMLEKLMDGVMKGMISWESFFFNVHRAGMMPESETADSEREKIDTSLPGLLSASPEEEFDTDEE